MSTEDAKAFLAEPQICVLSTTGPGDSSHAMPMWYLYDEGEILFMTGPRSQKVKNVERTGKATVVVDSREPPYYAVMVKGDADIQPALDEKRRRATMSRYISGEALEKYMNVVGSEGTVTIRVRPTRFVEYHGRAGT